MKDHNLSNLERTRIQMEYVIPLIRDLQRILGADAVNDALMQRATTEPAATSTKADFSRMQAGTEYFAEGGALDYEVIASDADRFDMNVTRCGYTQMMEELGGRDVGHLLICNLDYPAAAKIGMELDRSQTQMQGADYCDFRYSRRIDQS